MLIARIIGVVLILSMCSTVNAQKVNYTPFFTMIGRNFKVSDSVKNNCNWQYAVVLVKTNLKGKITSSSVVNDNAPNEMKTAFSFLNNYTFPTNYKFSNKQIAFYYSISNPQVCIPKDSDIKILPEEAISKVLADYHRIKQQYPHAVIIPEIRSQGYYPKEID
ncbi:hypothetical protein IM792_19905 [Mucilaginibacter sp. JRF]|uniref:hypothetical protein n=1 Tax=Mucilaginibacter sp. JRF TaxID=2780088 RepID=UPI00187EA10D|nr:hypothetical protein [Mucilaginibacter sp. JRF]MBE9586724.1 hypothetical protein [Mucilaginibacter sp. JRF]